MRSSALRLALRALPRAAPKGVAAPAAHSALLRMAAAPPARGFASSDKTIQGIVAEEYKLEATGEIQSSLEQAAGPERIELELPEIYDFNNEVVGPFGTHDHPCVIPSIFDTRLVACTGGKEPDHHLPFFIEVADGQKTECPVCEQVFTVKKLEEIAPSETVDKIQ